MPDHYRSIRSPQVGFRIRILIITTSLNCFHPNHSIHSILCMLNCTKKKVIERWIFDGFFFDDAEVVIISVADFFLKTHDFLPQVEKRADQTPPPPPPPHAAVTAEKQLLHQHALAAAGAFTISHAVAAAATAVKQEPPFAPWCQPVAAVDPRGHQWSLPIAARAVAVASSRPQQQQQQPPPPERKGGGGFMDAGSRSSGGAGFDDDDGHAARREVSSSLKELTVRVEGKGGSCSGSAGTDQMPNTPRSKHSATEQRRRSKINDRFQLLRDLLPHNDQKRDKASFLLEVIEYIRFLQEKVQKYEVSYPEWNQENAKVVPWTNIYFRSSWKNAQNKGQVPADHSPDPPELLKNGSPYMFPFTGNSDNNNAVETAAASGAQDQAETNPMSRVSYRSVDTPSPNNVADKVTSQPHAQLVRPSPAENHTVNCDKLNNSDLAIDEGTISLSSQYSQELLNKLNHALENSGIDLSQASISVQINLGKRAMKRSTPAATSTSKELTDPASNSQAMGRQLRLGDGAEEHRQASKRHKSDNS
ncbi:transcription factor BIM2-like isoform X1 [Oryza glaberrima]|uniref:transcription factor BIM2-like isoform X1 n=1 Tax=Oryza glaberrima TaxID=4538 RepID=UPI00224C5F5F|nr:transcription factor BIM2-like isoform X1 [Oryza glaberrima]